MSSTAHHVSTKARRKDMDRERQDGRQQDVRASDADRDHAIAQLRRHHVEGRLDWEEFSERLEQASRARTRGDLRGLLSDLPPPASPPAVSDPTARSGGWSGGPGPWRWRPWLFPPVIALVILGAVLLGGWLFGGPGPYHRGFFPILPLLFWGLLLARFILPRRYWRRW
jgi:Domain of unknown function (DUF1707)